MEKGLVSRSFMCRAVRAICFGQTEKLKWKLATPTTQETFNISLIILLNYSHFGMTDNLVFRFLFWEEGNLHLNPVRQRVRLNLCFLSLKRVPSSAISPSERCYPGSSARFYNSFLKTKYFFQIFLILNEVHLFLFNYLSLCSKFSVESKQAFCTAVWTKGFFRTLS